MRPDEKLLTGTTAAKVKAAALAKYPGATIQRVETDSDGVYEAHVVTKAGDAGDRPGRQGLRGHRHPDRSRRRPGGHGDHDGDGPDAARGPAGRLTGQPAGCMRSQRLP